MGGNVTEGGLGLAAFPTGWRGSLYLSDEGRDGGTQMALYHWYNVHTVCGRWGRGSLYVNRNSYSLL